MGKEQVYTGYGWRNLRKKDQLEDLGVDERIIQVLRWIFMKRNGAWTGMIWLTKDTSGDL
jgi:hypothetical protein